MWYITERILDELLKKVEYSLENLVWSTKIMVELSQSILQKFSQAKEQNNSLLLRTIPLYSLKG
jgi:hypothetical protein